MRLVGELDGQTRKCNEDGAEIYNAETCRQGDRKRATEKEARDIETRDTEQAKRAEDGGCKTDSKNDQ